MNNIMILFYFAFLQLFLQEKKNTCLINRNNEQINKANMYKYKLKRLEECNYCKLHHYHHRPFTFFFALVGFNKQKYKKVSNKLCQFVLII